MNLLEQIDAKRRQAFLGNEERFRNLIDEGEAAIIEFCKNLDPGRPFVTSQELGALSSAFHKAYALYGTPQMRKLFIKHLEDSGLTVSAYKNNGMVHFRLAIPPVPDIYKDGLSGLKVLRDDE